MKIVLPKNVSTIINSLKEHGYDAYAVGGCVRDSILGRIPNDWDITTSAKPAEVKTIFGRTVDTGIQHGTVTVIIDKTGYEVTTYRIDGEYTDNRHPENVTFTDDLKEDLRRRDFTINAMAYNDEEGLIDIFGGREDIHNRLIRAVGNPLERFEEDALRIMRAVRFAGQLGYEIEKETFVAGSKLVNNLKNISAERIQVELVKLITSDNPYLIRVAYEMGITNVIMPEFDLMMDTAQNTPHHMYTVGEHTIKTLENIKRMDKSIITDGSCIEYNPDYFKYLRLCMLFHDMGKPSCKTTKDGKDHFFGHPQKSADIALNIMRRLKFDNKTINAVCSLVLYHDTRMEPQSEIVKKWMYECGEQTFYLLFSVQYADMYAQSLYQRDEKRNKLDAIYNLYRTIIDNKEPVYLKDLAINGKDLINEKIAEGRQIGDILQRLLTSVHNNPEYNNFEKLIEIAKESAKEI